jgi:hypothetical protein
MKHGQLCFVLGIAAAGLTLLSACNDFFDLPDLQPGGKKGYGKVIINGSGGAERTVMPVMPSAFDGYNYYFSTDGGATENQETPDSPGGTTFTLKAGTYTVRVEALMNDSGTLKKTAGGTSGSFTVGSGTVSNVKIILTPETTGKGTFNYSVSCDPGITAAITLLKWSDKTTQTLSPASGTLQLDVDTYLFKVNVSKGAQYASRTDSIHIYPFLTTTLNWSFTGADLITPAPGVTVTLPLDFSWVNQSGPQVNTALTSVTPGQDVIITANLTGGYSVYDWIVDGVFENDTSPSYTFSSYDTGPHTVTLLAMNGVNGPYTIDVTIVVMLSTNQFTTVAGLDTWLSLQSANTPATAYTISLNAADITTPDSLKTTLDSAAGKYVYLDLSGSTFTAIAANDLRCNTITGITLPKSVTGIANRALSGCKDLVEINVDPANTAFSSQGGILYDKAKTRLILYPPIKTGAAFTIPNTVTIIGDSAFGSENLTTITIPGSVTSIEDFAFSGCLDLTRVTFQGTIPAGNFSSFALGFNIGDLRTEFYAINAALGTPGTYIRSGTDYSDYIWTKQP